MTGTDTRTRTEATSVVRRAAWSHRTPIIIIATLP
jgi:hypothetical protein